MKPKSNRIMAITVLVLAGYSPLYSASKANLINSISIQSQVIAIGILSFQDETGTNAPAELGQKVAQSLQQKLSVRYRDILPRLIGTGADTSSIKELTVDQIAA